MLHLEAACRERRGDDHDEHWRDKHDFTLSQSGCAYEGPGAVSAGPLTIHVVNAVPTETPVVVYAALLSIDDGHTYDDVIAWEGDRPPRWVATLVEGETARARTTS